MSASDDVAGAASALSGQGWSVSRFDAGFEVAVLGRPSRTALVLGPVFGVDWRMVDLHLPNTLDDIFCAATECLGDENLRTVFSTRRHGVTVRAGLQARFGVGALPAVRRASPEEPAP